MRGIDAPRTRRARARRLAEGVDELQRDERPRAAVGHELRGFRCHGGPYRAAAIVHAPLQTLPLRAVGAAHHGREHVVTIAQIHAAPAAHRRPAPGLGFGAIEVERTHRLAVDGEIHLLAGLVADGDADRCNGRHRAFARLEPADVRRGLLRAATGGRRTERQGTAGCDRRSQEAARRDALGGRLAALDLERGTPAAQPHLDRSAAEIRLQGWIEERDRAQRKPARGLWQQTRHETQALPSSGGEPRAG